MVDNVLNPYADGYSCERKPIAYLEGQTAYTDLLSQNGYRCALAGKWHLGDSVQKQHGFSRWYTIGMGGCCYYHPDMVEDGSITVEHGKYVTELITDKALDYLEQLAGEEEPFYLSVHYTAPHSPWGAEHHPQKWIDYYTDCTFESIPDMPDHKDMTTGPVYGTDRRRENLTGYFAAVSAMDEQIGRILERIAGLGLEQDTLVILHILPGKSFADLLKNEASSREESAVVVYGEYGPVRMIRTKEWKYVHRYPYGYNELYDLQADPEEEYNLINEEVYAERAAGLRSRMESWFLKYAGPETDGSREGVTGSGQLGPAGTGFGGLCPYAPLGK